MVDSDVTVRKVAKNVKKVVDEEEEEEDEKTVVANKHKGNLTLTRKDMIKNA